MGLAASYILQPEIKDNDHYTFTDKEGKFSAESFEAFKYHRDLLYKEHRNKCIIYIICTIATTIGVAYLRLRDKEAF